MCEKPIEASLVTAPDYETPQEGLSLYCAEHGWCEPVYEQLENNDDACGVEGEVSIRLSSPNSDLSAVERSGFDLFHACYKAAEAFIIRYHLPINLNF